MAERQCYHCKAMVEEGEPHDCWTTTEAALTGELSEDLRDAWERLRETAVELGDQRIYASHKSIMFSRKSCYFFVRPKRSHLEVCIFLGRPINAPQVKRVDRASKSKIAHLVRIQHRDQVEAPITDWLREAYELTDVLAARAKEARPSKATTATHGKSPAARGANPRAGKSGAATTPKPRATRGTKTGTPSASRTAVRKKPTRARAAGSRTRPA